MGARWISSELLHLTLAFLGDVNQDQVCDAMNQVEFDSFDLKVRRVGYFGSKKEARVLWVGLEESEKLLQLHAQIKKYLREYGVHFEQRKFIPHISIARLKGASYPEVANFIVANSLWEGPLFKVCGFELIDSKLSDSGATYTITESFDAKDAD